jgi:Protein of unknown function (DUF3738)
MTVFSRTMFQPGADGMAGLRDDAGRVPETGGWLPAESVRDSRSLWCATQLEIMGKGARMPDFMTPRKKHPFGPARNLVLGAAGMLAAIGLLSPPQSLAQSTAASRPEFEAASIKPSVSGRGGAGSIRELKPGSLTYTDRNLFEYIRLAYGVEPYQVTHGPAVSLAERYDIVARAAAPVPVSQVKLMLRSLLEDRFKLTTYRETKGLPVYVLTVAKGGPRFKPSEDDGPMSAAP